MGDLMQTFSAKKQLVIKEMNISTIPNLHQKISVVSKVRADQEKQKQFIKQLSVHVSPL